jgi:hypothetical protein
MCAVVEKKLSRDWKRKLRAQKNGFVLGRSKTAQTIELLLYFAAPMSVLRASARFAATTLARHARAALHQTAVQSSPAQSKSDPRRRPTHKSIPRYRSLRCGIVFALGEQLQPRVRAIAFIEYRALLECFLTVPFLRQATNSTSCSSCSSCSPCSSCDRAFCATCARRSAVAARVPRTFRRCASIATLQLLSQRKSPRDCLSFSIWQNLLHFNSCRHSAARIWRVCGHRRALSARK